MKPAAIFDTEVERSLGRGFVVLLLALAAMIGISLFYARTVLLANRWVVHTLETRTRIEESLSMIKDAQLGQRGYLLTGEKRYLQPYQNAVRGALPGLERLRELTANHPDQQQRVAELIPLVQRLLAQLGPSIEQGAGNSAGEGSAALSEGKVTMDRIREIHAAMTREEDRLLARRTEMSRTRLRQATAASAGLLFVVIGTIVGGFLRVRRELAARASMQLELARARDAALQATRAKSGFLANMSHEIRTPMNGIVGMTAALEDTPLNPRQKEIVDALRFSADSLLTIINDILDFSKIEAGMLRVENRELDLAEVLEQAIDLFAERVRAGNVELVMGFDPALRRRLRGDAARLHQILINLLSNAVKFTERGEIVASAALEAETATHQRVRIEVRDTGIGIPEEAKRRLFQSFTQADESTTRRHGGTGLGLAIVKQLAALMGGDAGVESQVGLGSTFWVTVQLEMMPDAEPVPAALTGVRVLVVDDNAASRASLVQQIDSWGARADAAESAEAALRRAEDAARAGMPYAMIVIDQAMPAADGLDLAARISARAELGSAHLILLQSRRGINSPERLRQAGVKTLLTKPVRRSDLYNRLLDAAQIAHPDRSGKPRPAPADDWSPRRAWRVLVAEDNPVNQKVAQHLLGRFGLEADFANDGREAVEKLKGRVYDLVLMDCQMPEFDGYETTHEIRRGEGPNRGVWIVATTAHALPEDRDKCLDAGMDDYIAKPLTSSELREALRRFEAAMAEPRRTRTV